jgi:uncharacterized protein (TIGR00369 family)
LSDDGSFDPRDLENLIPPLHRFLGLEIEQFGDPSVVRMELTDDIRGPAPGTIHGGILATLADVTAAFTLSGGFDITRERPVTTDMHVRYFRQPKSGPITATARLIHGGRRILSAECLIVDGENRELVRATATYMIVAMEGLPEIG